MMLKLGWVAVLALTVAAPAAAQSADAGIATFLKAQGRSFFLEHARLVDGTGAPARGDVTIVIDDGRITHVGGAPASVPAGARHIDLTGRTIMPGLVMMHEHINYFSGAYVWDSMPGSVPKLLLAAGVTTARTAGSEAPQVDLNLKQRIDAGRAVGPTLFVTGAYLNGAAGGFLGDTIVRTADEAREITAYWGNRGATSIKAYSSISPNALRGAVEEANRRGMHVAGHLGDISCTEAADAGIHTIEHGLTSCAKDFEIAPDAIGEFRYDPASDVARKLIALLIAKNVTIVATPLGTEAYDPSEEELSMLSPEQRQRYLELTKTPPPWMPSKEAMASWNKAHREFERDFVASGGRLLIGGDAMDFGLVPGYGNHRAMIALVKAGFNPLRVIKFATSDGARFLTIDDRVGTVARGMIADLIVVRGSPDRSIEDIRNVEYVFKQGSAFDPAKLRAAARGMLGQH
jgi:imidazolonepropionase-like amidohydrolase